MMKFGTPDTDDGPGNASMKPGRGGRGRCGGRSRRLGRRASAAAAAPPRDRGQLRRRGQRAAVLARAQLLGVRAAALLAGPPGRLPGRPRLRVAPLRRRRWRDGGTRMAGGGSTSSTGPHSTGSSGGVDGDVSVGGACSGAVCVGGGTGSSGDWARHGAAPCDRDGDHRCQKQAMDHRAAPYRAGRVSVRLGSALPAERGTSGVQRTALVAGPRRPLRLHLRAGRSIDASSASSSCRRAALRVSTSRRKWSRIAIS